MYENFIAKRISALRLQIGVSARDMSLSIGQNESYINRIENGQSLPSMQSFFYICEYFKISPKDFFDEEIRYPSEINKFISILNQMNSEDILDLEKIAKKIVKRDN